MYLLIEIRHNIVIQCHKNCTDGKRFNYMLSIDINHRKIWVSRRIRGVLFEGLGVQMMLRGPAAYDYVSQSSAAHLNVLLVLESVV